MGLGLMKIFFSAAKIGDDHKQVDVSKQLETVLTSAEHYGEFTEI